MANPLSLLAVEVKVVTERRICRVAENGNGFCRCVGCKARHLDIGWRLRGKVCLCIVRRRGWRCRRHLQRLGSTSAPPAGADRLPWLLGWLTSRLLGP